MSACPHIDRQTPPGFWSRLRRRGWWESEIPSEALLAPLCLISFITGILDSGTYSAFGTFASNQTGNVILLTLSASSHHLISLHTTLSSFVSYILTGFAGGQIGHLVHHRTRWWLVFSTVLQVFFLALPTGLMFARIIPEGEKGEQWILVGMLGASSGFQVAIARNSGCGEVPTAMLSSPM